MSLPHPAMHQQILYQADPNTVQNLRTLRDRLRHICNTYVNRTVRVQTLDGHDYEGIIVGSDSGHLFLRVSATGVHRPIYGPGDLAILTLVLFELLVIVLLA